MFQRRWTSEKIISHILAREGVEPLNSHYYATTYPDVYAAAERFFGSWCNTLESCGFSYQEIRKYRTWNRERVLNEIRKLSEVHSPLSSKFVQTDHRPLYMAALKRFGNWGNAIRAAGLEYRRIRLRRLQTPDELKEEIRRLYQRGESLSYTYMRNKYQYLLASGMKKLGDGSWVRAREVCGIHINCRKLAAEARKAALQEEERKRQERNEKQRQKRLQKKQQQQAEQQALLKAAKAPKAQPKKAAAVKSQPAKRAAKSEKAATVKSQPAQTAAVKTKPAKAVKAQPAKTAKTPAAKAQPVKTAAKKKK